MSNDSAVNPSSDSLRTGFDERQRRPAGGFLEPQQHWRMALASIGDAVIVTDSAGIVTFLNPVAESLCEMPLRDPPESRFGKSSDRQREDPRSRRESR